MPRQPRPSFPGIAQHVVQRRNDGLFCFFEKADHRRYLTNACWAPRFQTHIEASPDRCSTIQPRGQPGKLDK